MKTLSSYCQASAIAALAVLVALIFTASARADFPVIKSIEMGRTNVIVTAVVPSGHARILLECRDRLGSSAWIPVAVKRVAGQGGEIRFDLPRTSHFAFFRVRADVAEPLPAFFYTGTNFFEAQPDYGGFMGWPILPVYTPVFQLFATTSPAAATLMNNSLAPVASRAVVESDIWRLEGDTLYFFNQNRGLQIIDLSNPDAATLRGTLNLPAAGEQMYLLPPHHVVLLARPTCGADQSQVVIVAVSNGVPAIVASVPVEGGITESRLVGTALYVAAQTARPLASSGGTVWESGTRIQSFDLAVPDAPIARSTLWYSGAGAVVHATDTYLFAVTTDPNNSQRSIVNAIDITAHDGSMIARASATAAGRVADKFKLAWTDDVLSVISEVSSAPRVTKLETFRVPDPRSVSVVAPLKLGQVELGHGESLFATRFDGTRAYVVTFLQVDPLWVVDISDPAHPTVSGELQVPGWSTYIHPMGNRLVAVGRENSRTTVSLFDVSDPSHPTQLARATLGAEYSVSEANSDEKAFTVLEDAGLILLPVQGYTTNGNRSWVQLLDLGTNSITARGIIEHDVVPRRATLHRDRIVSLSAAELLSVDASDRDQPQLSGRLALARSINRVFVAGDYLIEIASAESGPVAGGPTVRVATGLNPDRVLESLTLTNVPMVGATVRSNRLYVLQAAPIWRISPAGTNLPPAPTLWLTVVDLSGLPALNVLGQTAAASAIGWTSSFEPAWPKPNLLVWAGSGNNYVRGWYPWGMVSPGMPAFATGLWAMPSYESGRLLAFDVSNDNAPALLSEVNLADSGWGFSKPFATDGLVFLSHKASVANAASSTNTATLYGWPRFHQSFLDVVDYSDARHPAVRPPVNIPGTLQGVSPGVALLYTVGSRHTSTNWYVVENTVDASAYDGVSAYLVDSLALSNSQSHPVLVSGTNVFLGRAPALSGATDSVVPTLETWTVSSAGRFTQLGSVTLPGAASDLVSFPGLLAASLDGTRVLVFDNADPAALRQVGQGPAIGCFSFDLRQADAVRARGLWIPLDNYGVTKVELSP